MEGKKKQAGSKIYGLQIMVFKWKKKKRAAKIKEIKWPEKKQIWFQELKEPKESDLSEDPDDPAEHERDNE